MAKTLQSQGVPIQSSLKGPKTPNAPTQPRGPRSQSRSASARTGRSAPRGNTTQSRGTGTRPIRDYGPTRVADRSTSGIGMLEAEFFAAIGLLILLAFSDTSNDYGSRIMSIMKRGTLVIILFFVLALLSTIGPAMEKVVKAFGALVIIGILITSPVTTVFGDLDSIIKNDWVATGETQGSTADTGTNNATSSSTTNPVEKVIGGAESGLSRIQDILNTFGLGFFK